MRWQGYVPAEVLRARRTAAGARAVIGACGVLVVLAAPPPLDHRQLALIGFGIILATAAVQLATPGSDWLALEESLAPVGALLIVGLQSQTVTVISILWLAAVASGVMARGGRVHWVGWGSP